ncbi:MAG: four helix bundle protein [Candidatus Magasanikbacteria bacterium]|nr:four helix bundle protein [Candidatus Magasanikbacteria bacterium]
MSNERNSKYNLEERTAKFGEDIIMFVREVGGDSKDYIVEAILKQLVRSGISVGANYCEADCAETKKDFEHKIGICNKEAKETKHWLRMIAKAKTNQAESARKLWKEAHELNLIFTSIIRKSKENSVNEKIENFKKNNAGENN